MEKKTIAQQYEEIIAKVEGILTKEQVEFLTKRKELHEAKNATRKPTKTQEANEGIKAEILKLMEPNRAYSVSEIQKAVGLETNQKTSALLRQLVLAKAVVRSESKGKAYFTKA